MSQSLPPALRLRIKIRFLADTYDPVSDSQIVVIYRCSVERRSAKFISTTSSIEQRMEGKQFVEGKGRGGEAGRERQTCYPRWRYRSETICIGLGGRGSLRCV